MTQTPVTPSVVSPPTQTDSLADRLAAFLTDIEVAFQRDGEAFTFALQGRDVLASTAPGVLRLYTPLIEGVDEAEAVEAIALLDRAAPLPSEYLDQAAYIVDRASRTAGLNLLLIMPRTFSAPALGDACELIVEVAEALTRQAASA